MRFLQLQGIRGVAKGSRLDSEMAQRQGFHVYPGSVVAAQAGKAFRQFADPQHGDVVTKGVVCAKQKMEEARHS